MPINQNIFLHDADKAALNTLKSIPGFSQVLKALMSIWNEKLMYISNMSMNVKISENQLKKYYDMLPPICEKLGIEVPDLFLQLDVNPNAYTSGDTHPFIVITSGLLETLPEELIPTVLAHECGHIACHHVLYSTMGRLILSGALRYIPSDVARIAVQPIQAAFSYWMRCSEFSADRAAILCDGTPDKMLEVCARFAGFDKDISDGINMEAFMAQAQEYKDNIQGRAVNRAIEFLMFYQNDHPLNAVRAFEANEWSHSENFIKSKAYFESYKAGQLPKEFPINWNENHFTGRDYQEVENELYEAGFDTIEMIRKTDRVLLTKEGSVTGVTLNGSNKFKDAEWYLSDSKVEVTYYLPFSEEEIAAMHPGEVKLPNASKYYNGKKYGEVLQQLTDLGFVNILREEIRDINKTSDKALGTVSMVTIDKSPSFSKGEWKSILSEVKIYYHALVQQ